jgi:hypothetical protein
MIKNADVPEWLTGLTANQLGFALAGSNPVICGAKFSHIFFSFKKKSNVNVHR